MTGGGGQYDEGEDKHFKRDLALKSLAWKVSPAALSIFLSVGTSMLVFPFFTYVHSTGLMGERLPQVLRSCHEAWLHHVFVGGVQVTFSDAF